MVARLLLQARQKSQLTQRDVAARLSKPAAYPHKVEHGEREINIVEMIDYCAALGIDFATFAAEVADAVRQLRAEAAETSSTNPS